MGAGGRGLSERSRRPRPAAAARRRGDRVDRRVVLLHPARPRPAGRPRTQPTPSAGVAGEYWGVHGGGFYHSQKYKVAPPALPEHLHWFKWEAYTTWLSGFALLVVLYWLDADTRLVDPAVADLSTLAGRRDLGRGARARVARVRRRLPRPPRRPRRGGRGRRARRRSRRSRRASSSRRARPSSRSARCSGRSWRRTSSS